MIAENVCDYVPKRNLKLSIYLVKDPYLRSLELYGNQAIPEQLKEHVRKHIWKRGTGLKVASHSRDSEFKVSSSYI